jgi:hypothetical protein
MHKQAWSHLRVQVALDAVQAAVEEILPPVVPHVVVEDLTVTVLQLPLEGSVVKADGACNMTVSHKTRLEPYIGTGSPLRRS